MDVVERARQAISDGAPNHVLLAALADEIERLRGRSDGVVTGLTITMHESVADARGAGFLMGYEAGRASRGRP